MAHPPPAADCRPSPSATTQQQAPSASPASRGTKPDLASILSVHDFESVASQSFSPQTWAFVSSAATDLHTKARNAATYARITLRPRILRDVSVVDTATSLLGYKLHVPLFASPTALAGLVHPDGEKAIGRAVKAAGMAQCVSMSASYPLQDIIEEIRRHPMETGHETPVFVQFFVNKDRAVTRRLLQEAKRLGVSALFLTVDAAHAGKREADERIRIVGDGFSSPSTGVAATRDAGLGRALGSVIDNSITWDDVRWIREHASGMKLVLKGVQTPEDAVLAVEAGLDGIVVSNHGGRTLDTAPATILVLLELRKRCPQVFAALDVMVDGGVTRGTDVFKALCLGAKAVGLGRATLYGLGYGYEGALKVFEILQDELEATMKLCGVTRISQLHAGYVNTLDVDHLI
ncbi:FMN-dependent dehydrogenase [Cordyceps militaris]|uniref:L-lactate dehydrogenase (cytochrome) n=1 Tax=Cordyceps militaris TaxID=73501 RepID=A0A2H4SP49_CORMI|nr:FMN-dependent dehydrogenase [Cordyceps militaris]